MLSAAERAEFLQTGVAALRGAGDPGAVAALREAVRARIAARGPKLTPSKFNELARAHAFAKTWGPRVLGALDDLLGGGRWHVPATAGQVLFANPPTPDVPWDVPHRMWHLDYPAPGAARGLVGVQIFLCLDRVAPRGGGTVVLAGVHRAVDAIRRRQGESWPGRSLDVRRALRREVPWFRELCSLRPGEDRIARFMAEPSDSTGESLRVLELTGEPGDVWLVHPWTLHAPAPSCGDRPRLVLTERIRAPES